MSEVRLICPSHQGYSYSKIRFRLLWKKKHQDPEILDCRWPKFKLSFQIRSLKSLKLFVNVAQFIISDDCKSPCLYFGCIILLVCCVNFHYFKCIIEEESGYSDVETSGRAWNHPDHCVACHRGLSWNLSKCNRVYVHVDGILLHSLLVNWGSNQKF